MIVTYHEDFPSGSGEVRVPASIHGALEPCAADLFQRSWLTPGVADGADGQDAFYRGGRDRCPRCVVYLFQRHAISPMS